MAEVPAGKRAAAPGGARRRHPIVAVLLQCLPLFSAASCVAGGVDDHVRDPDSFRWLLAAQISLLLWGLGYLYLGHVRRMVTSLLLGPAVALMGFAVAQVYFNVLYDAPFFSGDGPQPPNVRAAVDATLIVSGILVAIAVGVEAADAWRLAMRPDRGGGEPVEEGSEVSPAAD
jgi:hypothetical protein